MIEKRKSDIYGNDKLISVILVLMISTVAVAVGVLVWSLFSIAQHSIALTRLIDGSFLQ